MVEPTATYRRVFPISGKANQHSFSWTPENYNCWILSNAPEVFVVVYDRCNINSVHLISDEGDKTTKNHNNTVSSGSRWFSSCNLPRVPSSCHRNLTKHRNRWGLGFAGQRGRRKRISTSHQLPWTTNSTVDRDVWRLEPLVEHWEYLYVCYVPFCTIKLMFAVYDRCRIVDTDTFCLNFSPSVDLEKLGQILHRKGLNMHYLNEEEELTSLKRYEWF